MRHSLPDETPSSTLAGLPDTVRSRVVALTADALQDVARLPASLRRVAAFAPTRRARLGASAIAKALDEDDEFRARVATQVSARTSYDVEARAAMDGIEAEDRAALAWLVRPGEWTDILAEALGALTDRSEPSSNDREQIERLREKQQGAERSLRELRTQHRAHVDEYKAEIVTLRRKLGESRTAERAARVASDETADQAAESLARAETLAASQEKEIRRLRSQVAQSEVDEGGQRRAARTERGEATLRARILLDTVIDAANGLRRELALPAVSGAPGDRIEADLVDAVGTRDPSAAGSLGTASPALLEQYLAMPGARLIIDGYNVSKSAWPTSSLEVQRSRLLSGLAPVVARTGAETTVVFDAAAVSVRPVVNAPRGIKVRFSPEGVIADDVIRDLVAAEPSGRVVLVVTSDKEVVADVLRAGARSATSAALIGMLKIGMLK